MSEKTGIKKVIGSQEKAGLFGTQKKTGAHNTLLSIIGEDYLQSFLPAAAELFDAVLLLHLFAKSGIRHDTGKVF